MFYIETDKVTYNQIKTLLPDIKPDIKITLMSCDDNLEKLGFCSSAPCVVCFDLTFDELNHLLDDLMQTVPVWKLRCTPTKEAALVSQAAMSEEAKKRFGGI